MGEETFREELLTQMSERMGAEHYGEDRAKTAEALLELIIPSPGQRTGAVYTIQGFHHLPAWSP